MLNAFMRGDIDLPALFGDIFVNKNSGSPYKSFFIFYKAILHNIGWQEQKISEYPEIKKFIINNNIASIAFYGLA